MGQILCDIQLDSPEATCAVAVTLGRVLRPGDTLLLEGGIGAGKTHFARCLIQSRQSTIEDVPSPTFTLVQTYDAPGGEIWHADLYRLTHPREVIELGLDEAFETAICLVEWPDRLGQLVPSDALTLQFSLAGETARRLVISGEAARWQPALTEAGL
ncbi:tRNA (adenosine(37)-N6)-threonylcarbamoyltransferase complex ATPase subunit type 1 TsaE [Pseudooceanicola sp.]|uniref:tRNA (adenosine(37)-N6)-threonylcarbamoyltransferase complex ATPase subunit type 1 TsaE n=1 Tax=Pseudooceanicola sp. TaxID=1914328 RepID=UPI002632030F|nr:tRNA (adenosine(37)-N6)-threonylcarbamoyltransferase complex ATPase subunit type 1 TsaE [Pseudooceanicola sp.]MDF1854932.1 tRNA (adenosine(37)-N6)-threonylcarbamoyltransferase complex ATPase subunit type 1 TsaE [Pseudooceanicola sp.]